MPTQGTDDKNLPPRLLADDEPAPFTVLNGDSSLPVLLVCDHASRRFPASLGSLGLDPVARRCHLALDIGAGALTERLASELRATAVLCRYSRLVVDCNRELLDPSAFLEFGDGIVVPGNRNLHEDEKMRRADEVYWPYHNAIKAEVERLSAAARPPIFVSLHSFTPVLNGESRAWQMGVLSDADRVTAEIVLHDLSEAGFLVGDNEPYSGKAPQDFTVDNHAESTGLPHVGIEVRQDLIDHDEGLEAIGTVLARIIATLPARLNPTDIGSRRPPVPA